MRRLLALALCLCAATAVAAEPLPQHDAITWRSLDIVNEIVDFGHMADELDLSNEDRQRIIDALNNMVRHAEAVKPELKVEPKPDRDEDGIPDTEDECPDDATDKCNDVPPVPGAHSHFNALADKALASWSLRYANTNEYGLLQRKPELEPHPRMHYAPELDAARVTMTDGNSFSTGSQAFLRFGETLSAENCERFVCQSEFRFSDSCRLIGSTAGVSTDDPTKLRASNNWKFWRIDKPDFEMGLELQTRFPVPTQDYVALPTLRSYIGKGQSRSHDPISGPVDPGTPEGGTNYDMHPGPDSQAHYKSKGETKPTYVLPAETWIRTTCEVSYPPEGTRVRIWTADENTDPVLWMSDPVDPSKGYLLTPEHVPFAGWRHPEMNTSDGARYDPPHEPWHVWLRNAVVIKDVRGEEVLGGRPNNNMKEGE